MNTAVYCNECQAIVTMAVDNGITCCPVCGTMSIELKDNYPQYEGDRELACNYEEC